MLQYDYEDRLTTRECLVHPWILKKQNKSYEEVPIPTNIAEVNLTTLIHIWELRGCSSRFIENSWGLPNNLLFLRGQVLQIIARIWTAELTGHIFGSLLTRPTREHTDPIRPNSSLTICRLHTEPCGNPGRQDWPTAVQQLFKFTWQSQTQLPDRSLGLP